ncbi:Glycosyltransferase involved in cell wall bisynthesis [Fictibacillus solisalsi]|uniref:Glycosyltransferase involved in cell wall bisynthesis n=1 Tax=Fictibacillus solisalsi TaxID=459525 RepID=A0A1G9YEV9_9BACL|nr:glycosyltransferase family 4 protein [Fictibacillus solisalsi]SDN07728.1 Glycosyltransferase involved in cell wall bisynthesis [Fictibacillus solisalsi]
MNVLLMTDKLITGGAEMYFCKLENELQHDELTLFTAAATGDLQTRIKNKYQFIELTRKNHMINLIRLKSIIKEKDITILHANSLRLVLYAILLKQSSKKPLKVLYTKHNVTILEQKYRKMFAGLLNRNVDKIITVSDFEKQSLVGLGVIGNKIETIYNGVDLKQFTFSEKLNTANRWKVGILARLSEEKNHEFFLEVAHSMRTVPNLEFYIAGEGPEEKRILDHIHRLGLTEKVKMIGHVSQPETFIREMDMLLLTSKREVFPMVIIEAMAIGTPIISIDKGGIKEAIQDSQTGFLVEDYIVQEFSKKIVTVTSQQEIKKRVISAARKKVEQEFSLDKMVNHTLREYLSMA